MRLQECPGPAADGLRAESIRFFRGKAESAADNIRNALALFVPYNRVHAVNLFNDLRRGLSIASGDQHYSAAVSLCLYRTAYFLSALVVALAGHGAGENDLYVRILRQCDSLSALG